MSNIIVSFKDDTWKKLEEMIGKECKSNLYKPEIEIDLVYAIWKELREIKEVLEKIDYSI